MSNRKLDKREAQSVGTTRPRRWKRELAIGIILLAPGIILAVGFKLIPLIRGFWLSLFETRGFEEPTFIGLGNYERMLTDATVIKAFTNALLVVSTLPIWVFLPLVLALLLFLQVPGWKFFRASFFLPYMIAPIVVGIMFRQILAPDGPLNQILRSLGFDNLAIEWLNGSTSALFSLVGVALWSFFGLGVLNYLSALSTIPGEIIEASRLDGAGFWRMLVQVVLPMIKPMVGYWTVLCASGVLIWMFPLIYALTRGGPGDATMLPEFLVFLTTFQFLDRGYGSAIGLALFVFVAVISVFTVRYMYNEGAKGKRP
jgi:ABC-type sugar transport system permease subunit